MFTLVPGSASGIDAFLRWLAPRDIVHIRPDFHLTESIARRDGRNYLGLLRSPTTDVRELIRPLCGLDRVLVFSSPSNPFGEIVEPATIVDIANLWRGPVLVDGAYAEFAYDDVIEFVRECPNLFLSRTFSKAWGLADLRIGFVVGQGEAIEQLSGFTRLAVPGTVAKQTAQTLLANPQAVAASILEMRDMREVMLGELASRGLQPTPSEANFVSVMHPASAELAKYLKARSIVVKQLASLPTWPVDWPDGLRIAVCPASVLDELLAGIDSWSG